MQSNTIQSKSYYPDWRTFAVLLLFTLIVYSPVYGAGFVTDFLGWIDCYQNTSLIEAHTCFGVKGLYYIPFVLLYTASTLFGFSPLPWFLIFAGLHALNGFLLMRMLSALSELYSIKTTKLFLAASAFLFIVFPYQVEVIAWKACFNYLSACAFLLLTVHFYAQYLIGRNKKHLIASLGILFISLFNIEFALVLPFILAWMHLTRPGSKLNARDLAPVGLITGVIAVFLIFNRFVIGKYVGHYELDEEMLNPLALASAELKYLIKSVALFRFSPYKLQEQVYALASSPAAGGLFLLTLILAVLFVLVRRSKLSNGKLYFAFLSGSALILILPVAHLYFYYLQFSENDRYTYLALAFLLPALTFALLSIKGSAGKVILGIYSATALAFCLMMCFMWKDSQAIYSSIIDTFKWHDNDEVYLLNVPDNYRGTFMLRNIGADSALEEVIRLMAGKNTGKFYDVAQYNMATPGDGVFVEKIGSDSLKVEFNQWGNWWWRNGMGSLFYKNDKYKMTPAGKHYIMLLKDISPTAAFIYYDGATWVEFKDWKN
jgi:hypothetical protein